MSDNSNPKGERWKQTRKFAADVLPKVVQDTYDRLGEKFLAGILQKAEDQGVISNTQRLQIIEIFHKKVNEQVNEIFHKRREISQA